LNSAQQMHHPTPLGFEEFGMATLRVNYNIASEE
jgi:hypothetical protein